MFATPLATPPIATPPHSLGFESESECSTIYVRTAKRRAETNEISWKYLGQRAKCSLYTERKDSFISLFLIYVLSFYLLLAYNFLVVIKT